MSTLKNKARIFSINNTFHISFCHFIQCTAVQSCLCVKYPFSLFAFAQTEARGQCKMVAQLKAIVMKHGTMLRGVAYVGIICKDLNNATSCKGIKRFGMLLLILLFLLLLQ